MILGTDPILALYLVQQAAQQDYQPEWMLIGTGFIDLDLVGQAIAKSSGDEWSHAFGTSPSAAREISTADDSDSSAPRVDRAPPRSTSRQHVTTQRGSLPR